MTPADYRDALRLLDRALVALSRPRIVARRRLRRFAREAALLRARLGQAPAVWQRN